MALKIKGGGGLGDLKDEVFGLPGKAIRFKLARRLPDDQEIQFKDSDGTIHSFTVAELIEMFRDALQRGDVEIEE